MDSCNPGYRPAAGETIEVAIENTHLGRKVNHLHHAFDLKKLATELISKMRSERGVCVTDYGNGGVVECFAQKFPLEQRYVWLERSETLGLELRVMGSDVDRPLAILLLRPDGKALISGDREFERTVEATGFDDTCAEFLWKAADNAAVALPTVKF